MTLSTASGKGEGQVHPDHRRLFTIQAWLFAVALLVVLMVAVGGATRLTDSGLSITEWKPITGAIPPLSQDAWELELEKYRQIPEYQLINKGMSLDAFKAIYWWEWAHRFLGRLIGLAFFVPFAIFWSKGWLTPRLKGQGTGLLALGGLQGFMGWYMVASGLTERVDVSQYRLAMHLGLAAIILAAIGWVWRDVSVSKARERTAPRILQISAWAFAALFFVQIVLGALVAGLDAGLTFTTWPLMDGAAIPSGLFLTEPWYRNLGENVLTVQFNHRVTAYLLIAVSLLHVWQCRKAGHNLSSAKLIGGLIVLQAMLGVMTLINLVPIPLALLHQVTAFIIFALAVLHADALRRGVDLFDEKETARI